MDPLKVWDFCPLFLRSSLNHYWLRWIIVLPSLLLTSTTHTIMSLTVSVTDIVTYEIDSGLQGSDDRIGLGHMGMECVRVWDKCRTVKDGINAHGDGVRIVLGYTWGWVRVWGTWVGLGMVLGHMGDEVWWCWATCR